MSGLFFTFEGGEGAGKSTQIRKFRGKLESLGHEIIQPREPGSTLTGEMIRDILKFEKSGEALSPRCELLLFEAARAQLMDNVIGPALKNGKYVLCDRFFDSTTAYQGYGREMNIEDIFNLNRIATQGLSPDITFLLDLPVSEGMERAHARAEEQQGKKDTFEALKIQFHERVRNGYLTIAASYPERMKVIDASKSPDVVAESIWNVYVQKYGK